ncbi:MAG: sugar phosphate isomerase/epimerase family protein [Desulfatiglandales bacterium]
MKKRKDIIQLGGTARGPEDVKEISRLGLDFAEIPIKDPAAFSGLIDEYARLRDETGCYYLCHGPLEGDPNNIFILENVYLPKILAILPFMGRLGMDLLTIHLYLDSRFIRDELISYKIALLGRILEKTAKAGITLCLENLSESADDFERPFEEFPDLFMTLDLGHAQLLTNVNRSYGFMDRHPDRIKHVHVHDNRGGQSHHDDLHLPPGEGIIRFDSLLGELKKTGYRRTVTLELTPEEIGRCLQHMKRLLFNTP